jgi:hypothetical protein
MESLIVLHCAEFPANAQRRKKDYSSLVIGFRFAQRRILLMTARTILLAVGLLLLAVIGACRPANNLPTKSSPQYNELVRTFYIGLAALEVGHDVQAEAKLAQFTQLAATEPAGWANWGLLALRQRNYDTAAERLQQSSRSRARQQPDLLPARTARKQSRQHCGSNHRVAQVSRAGPETI